MTFLWKRLCFSSFTTSSPTTILYEYACRLGTPMTYKGERQGQWIHDIQISNKEKWTTHTNTTLGSGSLGLHTEMAFHHIRPRYVLLYCVRNRFTKTRLVASSSILSLLRNDTLQKLQRPGFQLHPPPSFQDSYPLYWTPLLDRFGKLRFASHANITCLDIDFYSSYQKMITIAETQSKALILKPNELLIINNELVHHGRDKIHPWDKDRLLYRMYVM